MTNASELRRVAAFSDLPDAEIQWFLDHAEEVALRAGETLVRQGDPPDWMFVLLDGLFRWEGEFGGDTVALPAQAGEINGVFPFSRMQRFTVSCRALSDGRILRFPAALHPDLIQKMPELTPRLVAMMSDRIREGTRIEQQRDRLLSLGKLSSGLAHELNNPASAATRAADQMRETLAAMRRANADLWRRPVSDSQKVRIDDAEASLLQSRVTLDGLALSDLEETLDSMLRNHGLADSWRLSGVLARCGMRPEPLAHLLRDLDVDTARAALTRMAASAEVSALLDTIGRSTARVSKLIDTVKAYSSMDQATFQDIDVVQSLETTLNALTHVLEPRISVHRSYQPTPLLVQMVGAELHQVWTNLIENAVEAMLGVGELRLRTFRDDHFVAVEIGDTGPGMSPDVQSHIFDPFFTTKAVGAGTGLGLNTVRTIVRKHGGAIHVSSKPGDTRFQVWLPWADPGQLVRSSSLAGV